MAYWILKAILTPLLRCLYRLDVKGADNVPSAGPVIVAANHRSFIDSIFIPLVVRRRVTFVAKAEYFEDRRTAWFFRAVGQIPIKRGGGSASHRALASAREVLDAGGVLGIYPEGTRSPDGRLYKGHTGVARLALACGAAVVPVGLQGTAAVQPIGARRPRVLRPVTVRIGAPLRWSIRGSEAEHPAALRQVTEEIMAAIAALSGQERADEYAGRGSRHRSKPVGAGAAAPIGSEGSGAAPPMGTEPGAAGPETPGPDEGRRRANANRPETSSFRR